MRPLPPIADLAIGQIGLWFRDVDAGRADLGYWTAPSARGRGVAGHIPRLHLFVEPWNAASVATAERCGLYARVR